MPRDPADGDLTVVVSSRTGGETRSESLSESERRELSFEARLKLSGNLFRWKIAQVFFTATISREPGYFILDAEVSRGRLCRRRHRCVIPSRVSRDHRTDLRIVFVCKRICDVDRVIGTSLFTHKSFFLRSDYVCISFIF